jgi:hypothetical protein
MSELAFANGMQLPKCPNIAIGELSTYEYGPKVGYKFTPGASGFGVLKIFSDMSNETISIKCTMSKKCGVNSFSVLGRCNKEGQFEGAKYECHDGRTGTVSVSGKGCLTSGALKDLAESRCFSQCNNK